jgi:hypothetical protein
MRIDAGTAHASAETAAIPTAVPKRMTNELVSADGGGGGADMTGSKNPRGPRGAAM